MAKEIIHTEQAPAAVGAYSQAVKAGNTVYLSGQIAIDPETQEIIDGGVEEQAGRVLKNLKAVLAAADCSFKDVVKTEIFLDDINDFAAVNSVYAEYFTEEQPARACVAVGSLPKGVAVEISLIAVK
ncbi:Endoribonuclease L-PSP [Halanaerobium congolense]|jgi:2-iminobutanoate/2-iminopropanoate deaminase|uniref:Endoribonuclease L-PSP n=1 Tax=Halanaerobium congolense TaxID=54121 RepID=A0A1I0DA70_9FIRM|nr:RidA family protein [Halanaerobium congolense]PTX16074.1 2-iminobutanoate/2-iminopropanoate deaminase [Halanaerobium congolense]SDG26766.1 Endoribonuclease L-PSP [Halanaerobium congolense]SET29111.1 Endoribonuclease L-PSP [Halanaerobium congolense]SFP81931.1 Endoribonuclease L-PSP [Halanaerobium congolense]